jgi:hypothetical protein
MQAAEQATTEALLSSFKTISAPERRRHATVYNYWLSIRGKRDFPALRDLDPLEISDAGPCSVLLQLIGGGEDAEIRHLGETLKADVDVDRITDAPRPSLLACIASKLAIVPISRDALAFEDEFTTAAGTTRCRVTLLPFSSTGAWVDYVYAFVTLESDVAQADETPEINPDPVEETPETIMDPVEETPETIMDAVEDTPETITDHGQETPDPVADDVEPPPESEQEPVEPVPEPPPTESSSLASASPGFSTKSFDRRAAADGFFGNVVNVEVEPPAAAAAKKKDSKQPNHGSESPLQNKLTEVRAKADEARAAKLQSDAALYEGLSAAYDFALDAEDQPEEYLKLVEAQGLKIQLRSPMTPVVKLAFDGRCDESTIAELEGVLAWALEMNLPRGSLAARIEAEGGIAPILSGQARNG